MCDVNIPQSVCVSLINTIQRYGDSPACDDDSVSSGDRSSADLEVHNIGVHNAEAAPAVVASAIAVVVTIVRCHKVRGRRQEQQHSENRGEALHGEPARQ